MKDGVCPKCGSSEVYSGKELRYKGGYREGNVMPVYGYIAPVNAPIDRHVCIDCGYVESYISDPSALRTIAAKWQRADGRKKKNDE